MQYSIVNYKTVRENSDFRIDAEYYKPEYLIIEEKLHKFDEVLTIEKISSTITNGHTPRHADLSIGEIKFLTAEYLNDFIIERENTKKIKKEHSFSELKRTVLKKQDILVTIKGKIGNFSVVYFDTENKYNINQDVGLIRLKNKYNPYFVAGFFNSKFGKSQSERIATGQINPFWGLGNLKTLRIPILSNSFQLQIEKVIKHASQLLDHSQSLYSQAEQILLSELGLLDWKPKHTLTFVKNFSDSQKAERMDAEYFQPKYEEIIEAVKRYKGGYDELGNLVRIKDKNFTPKNNEKYKYIELANISSNGEINGYTENFGNELPSRARRKVQKGDLIISSIEGSLESIALIIEGWENALCSTGFFVVISDKINSETLLVLLKTKVGQLQLKRGCKGTILTAIDKNELSKILIPKIDLKTQEEIKDKIAGMYKTKTLSKSLLEIAKRGVEIAIEKDEEEAEKWIEDELRKLKVEI